MKKGITRPSLLKRKRKHGFLQKMRTARGRAIIRRRRKKRRERLSV